MVIEDGLEEWQRWMTDRQTDRKKAKRREEGGKKRQKKEWNSATLAASGGEQHSSPVTGDRGKHVSRQIAPQTHWQGLSAERGDRFFLACSHARINYQQLQRGGEIRRLWWSGTGACGMWVSEATETRPFLKQPTVSWCIVDSVYVVCVCCPYSILYTRICLIPNCVYQSPHNRMIEVPRQRGRCVYGGTAAWGGDI